MNDVDPIAWADAEIARHRAEISKLEDYKRIELHRRGAKAAPVIKAKPKLKRVKVVFKTKKLVILRALQEHGPMVVSAIIGHLNKAGFKGVEQSNTSPLLSLYSTEQLIEREGFVWKITKSGREYLAANSGE